MAAAIKEPGMMQTICGGNIDWSATGDMLSGLGTVAGALAVMIAAWVGRSTFAEWKRQKLEERKIELAEKILALAYKVEEAFEQIRNPSYDAVEGNRALANMKASGAVNDDSPIEERSRLLTPQVTLDRINDTKPLWIEFAELKPVAKAVFGKAVTDQLDIMRSQRGKVIGAATGLAVLARDRCRPHREETVLRMDERQARYEQIIWSVEPEDDAFAVELRNAAAALDVELGPIIRSQS